MSFTSSIFPLFLLVVLPLWFWLARRRRGHVAFLVAASLTFYGWSESWWLIPLAVSCGIDFWAARLIVAAPKWRNVALLSSLGSNLLILGWFKYSDFVVEIVAGIQGHSAGASTGAGASLLLPAGISFYTFQSLSYTIDVWAGRLVPTRSLLTFLAYVSCFPQLVAGPIVRAADLLDRVEQPAAPTRLDVQGGATLIVVGFAKKLCIADNVAPYVATLFAAEPAVLPGFVCLWGAVLFAVQIYGDFSGYSDIARGLGLWLGLPFPLNFSNPYLALGFRDFWTRWHITLSTWFRDYVYIPLGGSRGTAWRGHFNLWCTFLLSGLWHGAAWHFVAWGAVHAGLLTAERASGVGNRLGRSRCGKFLLWALTLVGVVLAWVLFRAPSVGAAIGMYRQMFAWGRGVSGEWGAFFGPVPLAAVSALVVWESVSAFSEGEPIRAFLQRWPQTGALLIGGGLAFVIVLRGPGQPFIYFQF